MKKTLKETLKQVQGDASRQFWVTLRVSFWRRIRVSFW
jgi:hypothetical protein